MVKRWRLNFHPDKNKHMRIGRSDVKEQEYKMYGNITSTKNERGIGVVIDDNLTFIGHLAEKINKANNILGIIRRNFVHLDIFILKALYTALVRPHLEYANQIWCPHLVKDTKAIENVQRRGTRMTPQLKGHNYEERVNKLDLPILAYRRSREDQIETCKIITQKYDQQCI
ncbi:uncharacterized protein LOC143024412 [Oratosquilla oratoria]|uniref:uncharacterized protein LOC143024412 n=1 Tax=Oratosquilla oratoria TaxID=337810 RepID=UPI003F7752AD